MRKTWWLIESFGYCYHFMSSLCDPIKRRTLYIGYLHKFEQKIKKNYLRKAKLPLTVKEKLSISSGSSTKKYGKEEGLEVL